MDKELQKKLVVIGVEASGWTIIINDKKFSWDHNDPDMGSLGILKLLEYLGFEVSIEEWC